MHIIELHLTRLRPSPFSLVISECSNKKDLKKMSVWCLISNNLGIKCRSPINRSAHLEQESIHCRAPMSGLNDAKRLTKHHLSAQ